MKACVTLNEKKKSQNKSQNSKVNKEHTNKKIRK